MSAAERLMTRLENQYTFTRTADPVTRKAGGTAGKSKPLDVLYAIVVTTSSAWSNSAESSAFRLCDDSTTNVVTTAEKRAA